MGRCSKRPISILAAILSVILALLILVVIRDLIDFADANDVFPLWENKVKLKDISLDNNIKPYYPDSYSPSLHEASIQETSIIGSSETDGNVLVQDEYYIIVYSFKDLLLAQQKTRQLINDFNTKFILLPPMKDSYYRISYGKYSTLEEAKTKIISVRKTIKSDAWILSVTE